MLINVYVKRIVDMISLSKLCSELRSLNKSFQSCQSVNALAMACLAPICHVYTHYLWVYPMPKPGHHTPPTPEAGSHRHFIRMILAEVIRLYDVIPTEQ